MLNVQAKEAKEAKEAKNLRENFICSTHKKKIIYKCKIENVLGCVLCAKNYKHEDENIIDFDQNSMISHLIE